MVSGVWQVVCVYDVINLRLVVSVNVCVLEHFIVGDVDLLH